MKYRRSIAHRAERAELLTRKICAKKQENGKRPRSVLRELNGSTGSPAERIQPLEARNGWSHSNCIKRDTLRPHSLRSLAQGKTVGEIGVAGEALAERLEASVARSTQLPTFKWQETTTFDRLTTKLGSFGAKPSLRLSNGDAAC